MKVQILKTSIYSFFFLLLTACNISITGDDGGLDEGTSQVEDDRTRDRSDDFHADSNGYYYDSIGYYDDYHKEGSQLSPHCESTWEESMMTGSFQQFFDDCTHEAEEAIKMDPYFDEYCRQKGFNALGSRDDSMMMEFSEHCLEARDVHDPYYDDHYQCDPNYEPCDDPYYDPYYNCDPMKEHCDDTYYDPNHNDGPYLSAHCDELASKAEYDPTQGNIDRFMMDCHHEVLMDSEFPVGDHRISEQCQVGIDRVIEDRIYDHFYSACNDTGCPSDANYDQTLKDHCTDEEMNVIWGVEPNSGF